MDNKELSLTSKLIAIQSELNAPKGQFNKFGNYSYRSCEDILKALKPLLAKHECLLTLTDTIELIGNRYYVKATAKLTGSLLGEIIVTASAREEETKKGMDSSQITGAASSYARKYALNGMFAIDDEKDADTNENKDTQENAPQEAPKPSFDRKQALSNAQKYLGSENGLKLVELLGLEKDLTKLDKFSDEQLKGWISTIRQNAKPKQ